MKAEKSSFIVSEKHPRDHVFIPFPQLFVLSTKKH